MKAGNGPVLDEIRYQIKELADDDITNLVAIPRTFTGKTVCNPPFGVLAEVPSGLSVYKYQVCS